MKLVVGLGNPGTKYRGTRHNIGFDVVDRLAQAGPQARFTHEFDGLLGEVEIDHRRVLLFKPETFMNKSGRAVGQVVRFFKLPLADLLVVCDDLSLPTGKLRLRAAGSDGGHKGLRDIISHLGTELYSRLRIGIGDAGEIDAVDYVLTRFRSAEVPIIEDALILATQAVAVWVTQGIDAAMNRFNAPVQKA
jgi:PTH1 family peptidyl-tRNA hydrolase